MIAADSQSHQLPGEADLGTRITNAGYNFSFARENIYAYAKSVFLPMQVLPSIGVRVRVR